MTKTRRQALIGAAVFAAFVLAPLGSTLSADSDSVRRADIEAEIDDFLDWLASENGASPMSVADRVALKESLVKAAVKSLEGRKIAVLPPC